MAAYANLTEAQRERLEMLIEEAGEIVTIGTKILRHGYDSYHPSDPAKTPNRFELEREVQDFETILKRMEAEGDIDTGYPDHNAIWKRKLRWTHHQDGEGSKNG
jgi:hypothetical protein